jgi:hypothetical protein
MAEAELSTMNRSIGELTVQVQTLTERVRTLELAVRESAKDTRACYEEQSSVIDDHELRLARVEDKHKGDTESWKYLIGAVFTIAAGIILACVKAALGL